MSAAVFSVFAAMLALFPFLTPYLVRLGADASVAGAVVAAYSLANLAGNGLGGWMADRMGRAVPLLAGLVGSAATMPVYLAPSVGAVALAHAVHGLAAGMVVPAAFAWIGDRSLVSGRGKAMGRAGAAIGLAAVAAPPVGGVVAQRVGEGAVFLGLAGLLLAAAALAYRETRGRAPLEPASAGPGPVPWSGRAAGHRPERCTSRAAGFGASLWSGALARAYVAGFALQFGFGLVIWLVPLQAAAAGLGAQAPGLVMGVIGAVAALWMGLGGRLADRWGRDVLLSTGLALLAVALITLAPLPRGASRWTALAIPAAGVFGTGFGLMFPAAAAKVADAAPAGGRALAFSLFYAAFSVGTMAAPAVGGLVLDAAVGSGVGPGAEWAGPYLLGAGLLALAALGTAWQGAGGWVWSRSRPAGR